MGEQEPTGTAIRRHRSRAGLTQSELAARSGLSVRTVRGLETGRVRRPRGSSIRLLAEALAVPPDDLRGP